MSIFYSTPWWLLIVVVTFAFVVIACGGHILVRRSFPKAEFIEHNEVAGFIIAVVGVLYAVLLAFLTVVVWEQFGGAEERSTQEVDAATDIWRLAHRVGAPDGERVSTDLAGYTDAVLFDEWPKMKRGESSAIAQRSIERLFDDAVEMRAPTLREANLQNHLLNDVQTLADLRRRRINTNRSGVPVVLWVALVVGAATVIGFEYLFGMRNFRVQLLMTAATAIVIGLSFGVVIELDYPFRGDISISPERWVAFHEEISRGR